MPLVNTIGSFLFPRLPSAPNLTPPVNPQPLDHPRTEEGDKPEPHPESASSPSLHWRCCRCYTLNSFFVSSPLDNYPYPKRSTSSSRLNTIDGIDDIYGPKLRQGNLQSPFGLQASLRNTCKAEGCGHMFCGWMEEKFIAGEAARGKMIGVRECHLISAKEEMMNEAEDRQRRHMAEKALGRDDVVWGDKGMGEFLKGRNKW